MLDELAHRADVSRPMVLNVELGVVNLSVGTLLKLNDGLGIGLPALVESPSLSSLTVVANGKGAVLWTGDHGGRGVLLAGSQPPDVVGPLGLVTRTRRAP